jgi:hypothetical protein
VECPVPGRTTLTRREQMARKNRADGRRGFRLLDMHKSTFAFIDAEPSRDEQESLGVYVPVHGMETVCFAVTVRPLLGESNAGFRFVGRGHGGQRPEFLCEE